MDKKGEKIYSCSKDKKVGVWDIRNPSIDVQFIEKHSNVVADIILIENQNKLVSASWDNQVMIFDT